MEDVEDAVIIRWSNLSRTEGRGRERIYRVLAITESFVHVVELGTARWDKTGALEARIFTPNPPSKKARNREKWTRCLVKASIDKGTLRHVAEHGIPEQMAQFRSPVPVCPKLAVRKDVVAHIERHGGDAVFEDRSIYASAVRNAADIYNVSDNAARQWFEKHMFYGRHENALIDHDWRKGAPGVGRRDLRDKNGQPVPLGRRTKSEKWLGAKGYPRRRLTKQLLAEYESFIRQEAYDNNVSFPEVFRRWLGSRVAFNRDRDGNIKAYQVNPTNYPTDDYMKRVGRRLLNKYRELRDRGKRPGVGSNGGSAQDIVYDQLPVMDMDGTPIDNYVLFGEDAIESDGEKRPTVMLAIDRASCAIVGWDVSFKPENADAYIACYFSACTDKTRELYRWGVPHLRGMVYGCASKILIDRGPGMADKVHDGVVRGCRAATMIAEPGTGQAKGHGEGVIGSIQEALTNVPGSTHTTGDEKADWNKRRLAKPMAVPFRRFMQELLKAISAHNLGLDVRHLITPDMVKQKIPACPAEIFRYYKSRRRGDAAWDWAPEDIFRKLCVKRIKKAPKGIVTIGSGQYTSPDLQRHARSYAKMNNGDSIEITTYAIPNTKFLLLWELPGHGLGLLNATKATQRIFEDGPDFLIEYQNMYRIQLLADAKFLARSSAQKADSASAISSNGAVSKTTQVRIDDVERNAALKMAPMLPKVVSSKRGTLNHELSNANAMISDFVKSSPMEPGLTQSDNSVDETPSWIDDEQDLLID